MPALHTVQLAKILYKLTSDVEADKVDAAVEVFLRYLQRNRMISRTNQIITAFEAYAKEVQGSEDIHITSAKELPKETVTAISAKLGAGSSAVIETTIDESLIGGVVARKGNTIFDASIKTELERMARSLN